MNYLRTIRQSLLCFWPFKYLLQMTKPDWTRLKYLIIPGGTLKGGFLRLL